MHRAFGVCAALVAFVNFAAAQPTLNPLRPLTKIAFGSCADQAKPCPIWESIDKYDANVLVLLGDTIYADLDKSKKLTADLIRSKYAILDELPAFKKLREKTPILAVWDDHDYGKNDAGAEFPLKDESQQIFLDFWKVPKESPRRTMKGVYSAGVYGPVGQRVQIILLDGRYFLTGPVKGKYDARAKTTPYIPNADAAATFLGEEQWKWLEEQLKIPAELRLIGSGIQVLADEHPYEKWANLPKERERFYKLLKDSKANGVVILSGDRHLGELSVSTDAITYPLYDITSSGFNQGTKSWRAPEKNRFRIATMPFGNNFGVVTIDWKSETSPRISLQLRDEEGEVAVKHDIRLGLLTHNDNVAAAKPKAGAKEPAEPVKLPEGVLTPAEAAKLVDKTVTVQFDVKSARRTADKKKLLLNSDADFKAAANFTVMLTGKALAEGTHKDADAETFKGKTIRVTGTVKLYMGKPEIAVEDGAKVELVAGKE